MPLVGQLPGLHSSGSWDLNTMVFRSEQFLADVPACLGPPWLCLWSVGDIPLYCGILMPLLSEACLPSEPSINPSPSEKLSPAVHSQTGCRSSNHGTCTPCPGLAPSVRLSFCSSSSNMMIVLGRQGLSVSTGAVSFVSASLLVYGWNDTGLLPRGAAEMQRSSGESILWAWALPCLPWWRMF